MTPQDFEGTWSLQSYLVDFDDGRTATFDGDLLRLEFRAGEGMSLASTLRLVWKQLAPHTQLI